MIACWLGLRELCLKFLNSKFPFIIRMLAVILSCLVYLRDILGLGDSMVVRYYRQWSTIVIYIHIYYYSEICYRDSDVVKYSLVIIGGSRSILG